MVSIQIFLIYLMCMSQIASIINWILGKLFFWSSLPCFCPTKNKVKSLGWLLPNKKPRWPNCDCAASMPHLVFSNLWCCLSKAQCSSIASFSTFATSPSMLLLTKPTKTYEGLKVGSATGPFGDSMLTKKGKSKAQKQDFWNFGRCKV